MDLKEEELLGEDAAEHWYYRAKAAAMQCMLGDTPITNVLDVGAGSGFFARHLLSQTTASDAICVDPNYLAERTETHNGKPIRFVHNIAQFGGNLVLMMDVLEHVPNDAALLAEYVDRAGPGTRFLITVPALAWMWSGHDVFLEHYRRYTVGQLDGVVAQVGLQRIESCYYFGLTLPLAAGMRFGKRMLSGGKEAPASGMQKHSRLMNAALWTICRAELGLFRFNRLAGLSVICLAVKP